MQRGGYLNGEIVSKKGVGLVLSGILSIMIVLMGCGIGSNATAPKSSNSTSDSASNSTNSNVSSNLNEKVTLIVAILAEYLDYWKKTTQSDSFKKTFAELDLQSFKDVESFHKSWAQFVSTAKTIQDSGKYQGLALGGKIIAAISICMIFRKNCFIKRSQYG